MVDEADAEDYKQQDREEAESRRRERIRGPNIGEPCETCGGEGYGKVPLDYGFCGPECPDCRGTGVRR